MVMATGLVLVRLAAGREQAALEKIKAVKGVVHVTAVFGRWDLVVDVEAPDMPSLASVVVSKIRAIQGVFSTETLLTTSI